MTSVRGKFTAEGVTLARALGSLELDPSLRNPDTLAPQFLRPLFRLSLLPVVRHLVRIGMEAVLPGAPLFLLARTKSLDAYVLGELTQTPRPEQLVILGAGLDSRPYRMREALDGVRVFEVDLPATAEWKQARLRENQTPREHVTFVGIDFAHEALDAKLAEAGFRTNVRTVFLWEGVTYYLPESAVRATLAVLGQSAPGSSLAFDFLLEDALLHPDAHRGARIMVDGLKHSTEPFLF
ncbi:MAG: SAM-dependent methyltransferase, partial [Deltaproteobacteria bacterium]|nr:SAM-dependent methyltransferase [Deltaproteobacteria bacterium]